MKDKLHQLYPFLAGLVFLAFGLATLIRPEILSYYSIAIDTPSARIAIRAMIGGGELGIAFLLLQGERVGLSSNQRSLIAAVVFLSVGSARMISGAGEGIDLLIGQPIRESAVEVVFGVLGIWIAALPKNEKDDS